MKEILVTEPAFVAAFQCAGSACPDHCCKGWRIDIDKPTYNKYVKSKHIAIKEIAAENLLLDKTSHAKWARVKLNPTTGNCPFLDAERLCEVQKNLGAQALSHTCSTYPRQQRQFRNESQNMLTLSCPEAARNLLMQPDAMDIQQRVVLKAEFNKQPQQDQFQQLIGLFCSHLLLAGEGAIEDNLYAMVTLLMMAEKVADQGEAAVPLLEQTFVQLVDALNSGEMRQQRLQIKPDTDLQWSLLLRLQNYLKTRPAMRSQGVHNLFLNGLVHATFNLHQDDDAAGKMAALGKNWDAYIQPWLAERPWMLRNYLRYRLWQADFPQNNGRSMLQNIYLILAEFFYLKSLMAAQAVMKQGIHPDDVVNIIYSFQALTQHTPEAALRFHEEIDKVKVADDLSCLHLLV
ncbi:lysine-N-methylase fliB [Enterobacterales bacterium CwR94]|nr:lysine-N-methylase fliB [Enterobacterales bacterium CwR94]